MRDFLEKRMSFALRALRRTRNAVYARRAPERIFARIYEENAWTDEHSRSGPGSNLEQTEALRQQLPTLLRELECRTLVDVPCGDFYWLRATDLAVDYIGGDIVPQIIARNRAEFANERRRFEVIDLIKEIPPAGDLLLNRDCLVHFSYAHAFRALTNMRKSGATWLLTTTFIDRAENQDVYTGSWRALNMQKAPFHFPPPARLIDEKCPEPGYADKRLGLWRIADLPEFL